MQESMRFCHVKHSMKRIEIPLSYIRDENKFKSRDSLFLLVQYFKTIFVTLLFNVLKLLFVLLVQCLKTFHFSHTQKTLCISIHPFHFYSFMYTCPQPFIPSHLRYAQTKNNVIYFQPFNDIYITPTLQYHLIITRMSRL